VFRSADHHQAIFTELRITQRSANNIFVIWGHTAFDGKQKMFYFLLV